MNKGEQRLQINVVLLSGAVQLLPPATQSLQGQPVVANSLNDLLQTVSLKKHK